METDSDPENDELAANCKKQKLLSDTNALATSLASAGARQHVPYVPAARDRGENAVSPSPAWCGRASAPPAHQSPCELEPLIPLEADPASLTAMLQSVREHNAFLVNEFSKLADTVSCLQGQVGHFAKEMSEVFGKPSLINGMPRPYDPRCDNRMRPGPKDVEEQRAMEPFEMGLLRRQMYELSNTVPTKRCGFRRIVDFKKWHLPCKLAVDLEQLPTKTQWKLWHYAFNPAATTQTVLTADEMRASSHEPKGKGDIKSTPSGSRPLISSSSHAQASLCSSNGATSTSLAVDS